MKLMFSYSLQGSIENPHSNLVEVIATPVAEDAQEDILLQLLRQQPELLTFTVIDVKGKWVLKKKPS